MTVIMNLGLHVGADDRDDAAVRPRAVPAACSRTTASPAPTSCRRSCSRWPSIRWSTSTTCPSLKTVISGAAPLGARAGRAVAERIGARRDPGLRHDGDEPGHAHRARRTARNRPGSIGKPLLAEHRVPGGRLRHRRGRRPMASAASCWVRGPQVMQGYLGTTPRRPRRRSTPTAGCTPATSRHVDADGYFFIVDRLKELIKYKGYQVAAGRARGAAAAPTRRSPTRP